MNATLREDIIALAKSAGLRLDSRGEPLIFTAGGVQVNIYTEGPFVAFFPRRQGKPLHLNSGTTIAQIRRMFQERKS